MSRRSKLLALFFFVLLLLGIAFVACTSGESHFGQTTKAFLRVCEDGSCEQGDQCECSVCTVSCSGIDDCARRLGIAPSKLPRSVRCQVPQCSPEGASNDGPGAGDICEVVCTSDDDCSFLDDDGQKSPHVCRDGACRTLEEPSSPGEPTPPEIECPDGRTLVPGALTEDGFAFCLDRTEVTVASYRACVDDGKCSSPESGNFLTAGREDHPVHMVTILQAEEYCAFSEGRLPTRTEWLAITAQGGSEDSYPWGDDIPSADDMPQRVCGLNATETCVVSTYPAGATAEGHVDLAGNVAELVTDEDAVCAAGGSYESDALGLLASSCVEFSDPTTTVGFRCMSSF